MEEKFRTQIYLTKNQHNYLKEKAAKYKTSMAEVLRNIIDKEIEKEYEIDADDPIFKLAKEGIHTGRKDGSVNHDKYIYRHEFND
jgi:hypothetical protein